MEPLRSGGVGQSPLDIWGRLMRKLGLLKIDVGMGGWYQNLWVPNIRAATLRGLLSVSVFCVWGVLIKGWSGIHE